MRDAILGLVIVVNGIALVALATGLISIKAATLRKALLTAAGCAVLAGVAWMVLPALQAAAQREAMSTWSAEERKLAAESVRNLDVAPIYDVPTLFATIHFFALPIMAMLVLRYRWVRPRLRGEE